MRRRPTVDVVVSTYNEERYIERCLDHVIGQDYPPELVRIWLVDGGSSDRTVEILRRRAAAPPAEDCTEGALAGSAASGAPRLDGTVPFRIGAKATGGVNWAGTID